MAISCEFEFTPAEGKISYNQLDTTGVWILLLVYPKAIKTSCILYIMITNNN